MTRPTVPPRRAAEGPATPSAAAGEFRPPERLTSLPPYPLADVPGTVARLRAEGRDVIDLGAGDPGLPVPEVAVRTLREASGRPELQGYAHQRGLPEFREAAARWMERRFGRAIDPHRELLPLIGSKEGIAHLALAVLGPGDRALVPDPGYACYAGGAHFAGAEIVRVPLRSGEGFRVPPERIRSEPGVRLVYLNYPNNPTGGTVERGYVEDVVAAARDAGAVLAYDNAYSEIAFDGYRPPGLAEVEGGLEAGVEFHSFSKSFNMTGWRLGWACGSEALIRALAKTKSFFDTGAYLAVQAAGAAVLGEGESYLEANVARLRERRDAAVTAFRDAGFDVEVPRATLYLWMPVPTAESSESFARRVLEEEAVVLLPGSALGAGGEGWLRAALTVPPERYGEAAARLERHV